MLPPGNCSSVFDKIVSIFPRFFEVISSLRSWQFRFLLAQWKKRGRSAKDYFFLDVGRMSYSDRSKATTYSVFCVQSQKEVLHPENFYIDCHNAHFVDKVTFQKVVLHPVISISQSVLFLNAKNHFHRVTSRDFLFPSLLAKKPRKFETATGKENS